MPVKKGILTCVQPAIDMSEIVTDIWIQPDRCTTSPLLFLASIDISTSVRSLGPLGASGCCRCPAIWPLKETYHVRIVTHGNSRMQNLVYRLVVILLKVVSEASSQYL